MQAEGDKEALTTTLTVNRHKDFDSTGDAELGFRMVEASPDEHPFETSLVPVMDDDVSLTRKPGNAAGGGASEERNQLHDGV